MGIKKKMKGGRITKGSSSIVDGIAISEMSREQLEPFVSRIQRELEREREERCFFQLERDKIKTFWEITRHKLEEYRYSSRNKDKQLEKTEAEHQRELKSCGQKIKNLFYGQHAEISELKVANMLELRNVEQNVAYEELLFLNENKKLKQQITNERQSYNSELRSLILENHKQTSKMHFDYDKRHRIIEHHYQYYLQRMKDEMELKNEIQIADVEGRKNTLVKYLKEGYENTYKHTNEFYANVIAENIALVSLLKDSILSARKKNKKMKNEIYEVKQRNTNLIIPFEKANIDLLEIQNEMNLYKRKEQRKQIYESQLEMFKKHAEIIKLKQETSTNHCSKILQEKEQSLLMVMQALESFQKQTIASKLAIERTIPNLSKIIDSIEMLFIQAYTTNATAADFEHFSQKNKDLMVWSINKLHLLLEEIRKNVINDYPM